MTRITKDEFNDIYQVRVVIEILNRAPYTVINQFKKELRLMKRYKNSKF